MRGLAPLWGVLALASLPVCLLASDWESETNLDEAGLPKFADDSAFDATRVGEIRTIGRLEIKVLVRALSALLMLFSTLMPPLMASTHIDTWMTSRSPARNRPRRLTLLAPARPHARTHANAHPGGLDERWTALPETECLPLPAQQTVGLAQPGWAEVAPMLHPRADGGCAPLQSLG